MSALDQTIKFIEANKSNTFVYETDISDPLFQSKAPYLELLLDAPYAGMLQEARALKDRFVTHRPQDGEGWRSLCVHGISAEKTGVPEEYGISGGVFYDFGNLWSVQSDDPDIQYDAGAWRHVVGASLFWNTPIGPLRFNFTRALKKEELDEAQNFDLTISTTF